MRPSDTQPKIIILDGNPDGYFELSQYLLDKALGNQEKRGLIQSVCSNPAMTTKELFATAFSFGVSEAISALHQGQFQTIEQN